VLTVVKTETRRLDLLYLPVQSMDSTALIVLLCGIYLGIRVMLKGVHGERYSHLYIGTATGGVFFIFATESV